MCPYALTTHDASVQEAIRVSQSLPLRAQHTNGDVRDLGAAGGNGSGARLQALHHKQRAYRKSFTKLAITRATLWEYGDGGGGVI